MLNTAPIPWLQDWASPALTGFMLAVSLLGSVPGCLAIAAAYAFGWRPRLGVTLIVAIVLADAMAVIGKGAFESPRPHAVDARVRTPAATETNTPLMTTTSVPADAFGFPSGHVATTTAWALGLVWSRRKPWPVAAAGTWIALMALSRMYLGRHFPVDVVGGLAVGVAALASARLPYPDSGLTKLAGSARTALSVGLFGAVGLASVFVAGFSAHDTGRFCGLLFAAFLLMRTKTLDHLVGAATRLVRVLLALVLLGAALWSSTWMPETGGWRAGAVLLAASAVLHASMLLVPASVSRP